jgi:hypothetical protein
MKISVSIIAAVIASLFGSAAAWAAEDVLIEGKRTTRYISQDEKAVSACFEAFAAQLLPGKTVRVRTVLPRYAPVFHPAANVSRMEVAMTARLARNDALLATSSCSVTRGARIIDMRIRPANSALLAGLTARDISFATAQR